MFGAKIVKHLADNSDAFVLLYSRLHEAIKLIVSRVDHHGGRIEQGYFILGLDFPYLVHELLTVDDLDALGLERKKHRDLDDVDTDRLIQKLAFVEFKADFLR